MIRQCGDCQLCCRIMPISEIGKQAGATCSNQKFKVGCKVHGTPAQPTSCRLWSCWWLMNPTFDLPRPDRAGYVVDPTPDFIVIGEDVHKGKRVAALQMWADDKRPNAWRAALPWMKEAIGDKEAVVVVRFGSRAAITIIPPKLSETGEWVEIDSRMMNHLTHFELKRKGFKEAITRVQSNDGNENVEV